MQINDDGKNPTDGQIRELQLALATYLGAGLLYEKVACDSDGEIEMIEVPPMMIPKDIEVRATMVKVVRSVTAMLKTEFSVPDEILQAIQRDSFKWNEQRQEASNTVKKIVKMLEDIDEDKKVDEGVDEIGEVHYNDPDDLMPDTPRFRNN